MAQLSNGEIRMTKKREKAEQRKRYKESFKKFKHGHGGLSIKKRDVAALGK